MKIFFIRGLPFPFFNINRYISNQLKFSSYEKIILFKLFPFCISINICTIPSIGEWLHRNLYQQIIIIKKRLILFTLLISFGLLSVYSQEKESNQEVFAKFHITDWIKNGVDMTPSISDQEAILVLYENTKSKEYMMSNYWSKSKSQSFGPIYSLDTKHYEATNENYEYDSLSFQWHYTNTYDDKKGTAKVELLKVYKPQGVYFKMTIIPENLDVLIYRGYMEGTLNLSVFDRKN